MGLRARVADFGLCLWICLYPSLFSPIFFCLEEAFKIYSALSRNNGRCPTCPYVENQLPYFFFFFLQSHLIPGNISLMLIGPQRGTNMWLGGGLKWEGKGGERILPFSSAKAAPLRKGIDFIPLFPPHFSPPSLRAELISEESNFWLLPLPQSSQILGIKGPLPSSHNLFLL